MGAMSLGLAMGGATALSTLVNGLSGVGQQEAQGKAMAAQADVMRNQARMQAEAGQVESEALDKQKGELRRQYEDLAGRNRVALGAGNVDMSSGSALKVADGNAARLASDIGETAYARALRQWETQGAVQNSLYQADTLDKQSSYARRTAVNLLPTLIGAGLSGAGSFMTGYSYGGGKLPGSCKSAK